MAYTSTKLMVSELENIVENDFKGKYEHMNAEDVSKIYYCFTEIGFKGDGTFYKYI